MRLLAGLNISRAGEKLKTMDETIEQRAFVHDREEWRNAKRVEEEQNRWRPLEE